MKNSTMYFLREKLNYDLEHLLIEHIHLGITDFARLKY